MASKDKIVIAFDLYGTLLSTESVSKELATHFGQEKAQSIAALWRRYQLEYTWRMNSMALYKPFSDITSAALKHALAENSVSLSDEDIGKLMNAYDNLGTFSDVAPALKALSSDPSIDAYVFSNGSDEMVSSSVNQSLALSSHASVFKGLVTVQEIEVFKPDPTVYHHLAKKVGKSFSNEGMGSIWLVSGNPFDIVGARAAGIRAAWVERPGGHAGNGGWTDQLGTLASGGPTIIVQGVDEAVSGIKKWMAENAESSAGTGS